MMNTRWKIVSLAFPFSSTQMMRSRSWAFVRSLTQWPSITWTIRLSRVFTIKPSVSPPSITNLHVQHAEWQWCIAPGTWDTSSCQRQSTIPSSWRMYISYSNPSVSVVIALGSIQARLRHMFESWSWSRQETWSHRKTWRHSSFTLLKSL